MTKHPEQDSERKVRKWHFSTSLFQFLPWLSFIQAETDYKLQAEINSFFSKLRLVMVFITAIEMKQRSQFLFSVMSEFFATGIQQKKKTVYK